MDSREAGDVFSFRVAGGPVVSIRWRGRSVTHLRGDRAARFLAHVERLDPVARQLEMAKATGNFKRGNERMARSRRQDPSG